MKARSYSPVSRREMKSVQKRETRNQLEQRQFTLQASPHHKGGWVQMAKNYFMAHSEYSL